MKHTWILAATALVAPSLAFAQAGNAPQPQGAQTQPGAQALSAADFVNNAVIGNMFEIQSSTLARQRSRNDSIRQFAERMILDHTSASDRLKAAAPERQIPTSLDQPHEQMLQTLRNTPDDRFDRTYTDMQVDAHRDAVGIFERYAQNGDDTRLKQFAQQILPTLRDHFQAIQQIRGSLIPEQVSSAQGGQSQPQSGQEPPRIVVQQPAPSVRVDQASPEITVQQVEPTVTVRQPQPEIVVHQPQPTVTINIPQPQITVRMAQPDVKVAMAQPQVRVNQPQPQVQVAQPQQQPQVQVERAQPQIRVEGGGQPRVEIQREGQPSVRFDRVEPRIVINQAQGQPEVRVEQKAETQQQGQPTTSGTQGQGQPGAQVAQQQPTQPQPTQPQPVQQQPAQPQPEQTSKQPTAGSQPSGQAIAASQLTRMNLYDYRGKSVGDVERVVVGQDGRSLIIVGFGGILGIGESNVAIPTERVVAQGDRLVLLGMDEEQVRALPRFDTQQQGLRDVPGSQDVRIGETK